MHYTLNNKLKSTLKTSVTIALDKTVKVTCQRFFVNEATENEHPDGKEIDIVVSEEKNAELALLIETFLKPIITEQMNGELEVEAEAKEEAPAVGPGKDEKKKEDKRK